MLELMPPSRLQYIAGDRDMGLSIGETSWLFAVMPFRLCCVFNTIPHYPVTGLAGFCTDLQLSGSNA
jgi:hypothetical protein